MNARVVDCCWVGGGGVGWRAVLPYMGYMSGADQESIIFVSLSLNPFTPKLKKYILPTSQRENV